MIIIAEFKDLDLSQLTVSLRESLCAIHENNELFYHSVQADDIEQLTNLLELGYPLNWAEALANFNPQEQEVLNNYTPPANGIDSTEDMNMSFENNYKRFENKNNISAAVMELLATYFFKREGFFQLKQHYFSNATNKTLVEAYVKMSLKDKVYPVYLNGLLLNKDSSFFDIFMRLNERLTLANLSHILRRPYQKELLNAISFKKAFDSYIDVLIEQKLNEPSIRNVVRYNKTHAINEVFNYIYKPEFLTQHIYEKYEQFTGVGSYFTPVALAYSEISFVELRFELEWERMSERFKKNYTKEATIANGNKTRHKVFLERAEKNFEQVFADFCANYSADYVARQSELLEIPPKYWPELYQKNIISKSVPKKASQSEVRKI